MQNPNLKWIVLVAMAAAISSSAENSLSAAGVTVTVQADQQKAISPDLFGILFEDINYAADGGLYAELVQNRSFEYTAADHAVLAAQLPAGDVAAIEAEVKAQVDAAYDFARNSPYPDPATATTHVFSD